MTSRAAVGDGVELEYEVVGEGPELVWLHGLGGNLEMDRLMAEQLGRDFRVLWYSSRGHGRSTPVRDRRQLRYHLYARDLERLLDQVGFERPLLAGGSHGANTLLRHEADHPGRARALLLAAPGGNALQRPRRRVMWTIQGYAIVGRSLGRRGLLRVTTGQWPGRGEPVVEAAFDSHHLRSLGRVLTWVPDQGAVALEDLARFQVDAHVVAWDNDPVVHPIALARQIAAHIPGATFEEIERLGDLPHEQAQARAADYVRGWALQKHELVA